MRPIIAAITMIAAVALPSSAPARESLRHCNGFITSADGAPAGVTIRRGRSTCATAKRVLRAYLHSHAPCGGSGCARRVRGWNCSGASPARYPNLASCNRGRTVIEAIAISD